MRKIDLHMHTKYSDGDYTVTELLKMAQKEKLEYMSITDHDNVEAYDELKNIDIPKFFNGTIINGVELRAIYKEQAIEILGYNYNPDILKKSKWVDSQNIQKMQEEQFDIMVKKCKKNGAIFDDGFSLNPKLFANVAVYKELTKDKTNSKFCKKFEIDSTTAFFRNHICNYHSPLYIDQSPYAMNAFDAVELIHKAGGVAILAHPLGTYNIPNLKGYINKLVNENILDGIECMHPRMKDDDTKYIIELCNKYDLITSGGSDFHRIERSKFSYVNFNTKQIPLEIIEKLLKIVQKDNI